MIAGDYLRVAYLPLAPSTNALFANAEKGRVKTASYKSWRNGAGLVLNVQKCKPLPVRSPYLFVATVEIDRKGDIDNRVKATIDLLVGAGLVPDDRWADKLLVMRGPVEGIYDCRIAYCRIDDVPADVMAVLRALGGLSPMGALS